MSGLTGWKKAMPEIVSMSKQKEVPPPMQPFGWFHELLDHEGNKNEILLGVRGSDTESIVQQAHTDGETDPHVFPLYLRPQTPTAGVVQPIPSEWKAALANLAAIVRIQNGNLQEDINSILATADRLLAETEVETQEQWIDRNVSGNPALIQAMKNIAGIEPQKNS